MGGVDSWFDDSDEKKVTTDNYGRAAPYEILVRNEKNHVHDFITTLH